MQLVIATHNVHKFRELRAMLKPLGKWDLISLIDFPSYPPPEETGKTFEQNSQLKARHAALALKSWVLADDSGLVVPALNGAPGVHSRRYAGPTATDKENRHKLLQEMSHLLDPYRNAHYACSLTLSSPDGQLRTVLGTCEGSILDKERGSGGFGFDPLFLKFEYNKTFAEIDEETKNRISHRRKALDKILPALEHAIDSIG